MIDACIIYLIFTLCACIYTGLKFVSRYLLPVINWLTVFFAHAMFYLKVLELGIVVHSVIIGMSLGASQSASAIKPLVVALSFHQFFEGIGLGGCIVQVCVAQHESDSARSGFHFLSTYSAG